MALHMTGPAGTERKAIDDLTPSTRVAEAHAYLTKRGECAAVVSDGGIPIGVITLRALRGQPDAVPRPDAAIVDVMDWECLPIAPDADPLTTLRAYRDASWRSLRRRRPMASDVRARHSAAFR
jgi:CBS domain-containing protein